MSAPSKHLKKRTPLGAPRFPTALSAVERMTEPASAGIIDTHTEMNVYAEDNRTQRSELA